MRNGVDAADVLKGGGSIFIPDTILPEQFYNRNSSCKSNPERWLRLAVLEDAIWCLQGCYGWRNQREAERWVLERERERIVFSFVNCCDAVEIDPEYLRDELLRLYYAVWERHPVQLPRGRNTRSH